LGSGFLRAQHSTGSATFRRTASPPTAGLTSRSAGTCIRTPGATTEAAAAVLADAFDLGLPRAIAVTHPDNHASQAVCRRLGMTALGPTTRYYDTTFELFALNRPR
jgi:hypothetical protein